MVQLYLQGDPMRARLSATRNSSNVDILLARAGSGLFSVGSEADCGLQDSDDTSLATTFCNDNFKWRWYRMMAGLDNSGVHIQLQPRKFYKLSRILGQGGFGTVLQCHQPSRLFTQSGKIAAAKVAIVTQYDEVEFERAAIRLATETEVLGRLRSLFIISLKASYAFNNEFWLVMELCDGGTVSDTLVDLRSTSEIGAICACVTSALVHIHNMGICHRDVKPNNILLHTKGAAKLADFGSACGLASTMGECAKLHFEKFVAGTLHYLAPECCCDRPTFIEARSEARDVWALGICANEMLYGIIPRSENKDPRALIRNLGPPSFDLPPPSRVYSSSFMLRRVLDFAGACLHHKPRCRMNAICLSSTALVSPYLESAGRHLAIKAIRALISRRALRAGAGKLG